MTREHRVGLALPHWLEGLECALDDITKFLFDAPQPEWAMRLEGKINLILQLEGVIITDQETLDADVAKLVALENAIAAEIAALKNQPAAAGVDFSGLDSVIGSFGTLVDTPPVDAPVDPPVDAPVDAPVETPAPDSSVASV